MYTDIFLFISFGIIIILDIIILRAKLKKLPMYSKWKLVTEVFRRWYKTFPFAPYAVGALFIGHFGKPIPLDFIAFKPRLIIFIVASLIMLIWCIFESALSESKHIEQSKFYKLCCKVFLIPMTLGTIAGSCWYS